MVVAFSGRGICLACVKALSQSLHKKNKKFKPGHIHSCNPSSWWVKVTGSGIQV